MLPIEPADRNFRTGWLWFTGGYFLIYPLFLIGMAVRSVFSDHPLIFAALKLLFSSTFGWASLFLWAFFGVVPFFFLLYFTYYKPGTKLLASYLFFMPIAVVRDVVISVMNPFGMINWQLMALNIALSLFWFYLCLRLRTVNKKIRSH